MGLELASTSNFGFKGNGEEMYVSRALIDVYKGDTTDYQLLVNTLHRHEGLCYDDIVDLEIILNGLVATVSNIDLSCHGSLLKTIFGMSMWNYTPGVMDALVELIVSLAVASDGKLLDSCITMLIANFVPPLSFQKLLDMPRGVTRKEQVFSHVHVALEQISDLVPLAPARILAIVIQRMPFIMRSEHTIWIYVENMLRLEKGSLREFLGSKIFKAVMDRLLDLDVEIEWDEANREYRRREIFEMELEDMDEAPIFDKKEDVHKFAEKLDSLMVMVFDHLNTCNADARLEKVFETLLCSFKTTLLNAYKSKFTQFIIFYACSLDPKYCGKKFARTLASIFFNCGEPRISRMSAAAYLASYLARAKFHEFEFVAELLNSLVCWCLNYCQRFTATRASLNVSSYGSLDFNAAGFSMTSGGVNPKFHSLFYAGCQAIIYIMCFHMRSCEAFKAELFEPLNEILNHELGPLKVCLPTIVNEFLRQAGGSSIFTKKTELADSDEFMFPDTFETDLSMTLGGMERLEMFFPFDPILLTKSDRFIRPHYIYWSSVNPTYVLDERDTSDEDNDSEQENDNQDHDMTGSLRESELLDECDQLNKMSVSSDHYIPVPHSQDAPHGMPSRIKPSIYPESF